MSCNILQMELMTWESAHQPLIFYHLSRDGSQGSGLSSEAQRSLSPTISLQLSSTGTQGVFPGQPRDIISAACPESTLGLHFSTTCLEHLN